jgi:hypothetical protein
MESTAPGPIFLAIHIGTLSFNSPVFNLKVSQLKTEVHTQTIGDPIVLSNSVVDSVLVVVLFTALVPLLRLTVKSLRSRLTEPKHSA